MERLEDGRDGERAVARDDLRDLPCLGDGLAVGYDVADQAELLRFGRVDVLAREKDVGRLGVGDLAGQAHRGAAGRVERPPRLGHAEAGALTGDADVGALEHLGAAGDGDAFDRGDQRLRGSVRLEDGSEDEAGVVLHALRGVDGVLVVDVTRERA